MRRNYEKPTLKNQILLSGCIQALKTKVLSGSLFQTPAYSPASNLGYIGFLFLLVPLSALMAEELGSLTLKAEIQPDKGTMRPQLVTTGLENPWGMAFLPTGDILITEKSGTIRIIRKSNETTSTGYKLAEKKVTGLPQIKAQGQGGLLDIELHPEFPRNNWLYLTFSDPRGSSNGANTSLLRAELRDWQLINQKLIYRAEPNSREGQHFGSRIEFGADGKIYFSVGDRGQRDLLPQRLDLDGGKIYRLNDDGSIPSDNPFVGKSHILPAIFSFGHRNPQGLALNKQTGELWSHEHGPKGGDELNIIRAGANYGWPEITYGRNYIGTKITEETARAGMKQPLTHWTPSIAPCGMDFIEGNKYPGWEGDIILGSLKFGYLLRLDIEGNKVKSQEIVASGLGRVRNVKQGPDGWIYVAVEGKGLFKLVPKNAVATNNYPK